jgi:hypothetical protein
LHLFDPEPPRRGTSHRPYFSPPHINFTDWICLSKLDLNKNPGVPNICYAPKSPPKQCMQQLITRAFRVTPGLRQPA